MIAVGQIRIEHGLGGVTLTTPVWFVPLRRLSRIKRIYGKIRWKSLPNRATWSPCIHCEITYLAINNRRCSFTHPFVNCRGVRKRHLNLMYKQEEWFIAIKIIHLESPNTNHIWGWFWKYKAHFQHIHNEPYQYRCHDGGWHAMPMVT